MNRNKNHRRDHRAHYEKKRIKIKSKIKSIRFKMKKKTYIINLEVTIDIPHVTR